MYPFKSLLPASVWKYFHEICQIPRPSKKEEKIIEFLLNFAKKQNLKSKKDKAGNIVIKKTATKGFESLPIIVLQAHMDMVCEKNIEIKHDFDKDPIQAYIDGEWVKARGTTLGADDGIGMAVQLALLAAKDIKHGPLECLFTVDEETGLTGAFNLEADMFEGKILINLDSEDEGEIFIGCAGGIDTLGTFNIETEKSPKNSFAFNVNVSGLKGGHSGDDIHLGLANANKILIRFIKEASRKLSIKIANINGGNLRNAIAREAAALCVVPSGKKEDLAVLLNNFIADLEEEFGMIEANMKIKIESADVPEKVFSESFQNKVVNTLYAMPHGVISMSKTMPGLVETSTNLASIKTENNKVIVASSQRSSLESGKKDISSMVESVFLLGKANVKQENEYPGWTPKPSSNILKIAKQAYSKIFKQQAKVRAIHAGLECGLFLNKYPNLDMISIGPTIKGAHSPDERLEIDTVKKFWDFLLEILISVS